ncbi:hypothetical protein [Streptomyces sp. NBC_01304]|uniref:hypothetical protein n=1 Tax=Streptomyces sp. NBC_01304 TaxID=2903818 RepID=UPI002E155510|nr:hypothetical protein OG430_49095 [Streptomyces sp. NBC_01304]
MASELPDIYEARQGHALREAMERGDTDEARRIVRHVIAEAALNDDEKEMFRDTLAAAFLFREQMQAAKRGDQKTADRIAELMTATVQPRIITQTVAAGYLQAGLREGLPANRHDQLMAWIDELNLGPEIRTAAAKVRRLPAETDNSTQA